MEYREYKTKVEKNLRFMTRTLNGVLDTSASETKADAMAVSDAKTAAKLASGNTDRAFEYIYENRNVVINNKDELGKLFLKIAEIVDDGIVKPGCIFRSGSKETKYPYAKVEDLPYLWDWFIEKMFEVLNSEDWSPMAKAAFAEYYINCAAHFFADGCGKISILIGTFILMRHNYKLPDYRGRDEYFELYGKPENIDKERPLIERHFNRFMAYYRSLFGFVESYLYIQMEKGKNDKDTEYIASPTGILDELNARYFEKTLEKFFEAHPDEELKIDCIGLEYLTAEGVDILQKFKDEGRKFTLENVNQDCYVALLLAGMDNVVGKHVKLPAIDVSECAKIGEGANGIVYRLNDEIIIKTFKKMPDFRTILKERSVTKHAMMLGIPCPISFGYALVDGKIALMFEMVKSTSFIKTAKKNRANIKKYMGDYVGLIHKIHEISGEAILPFPRRTILKELMEKADRLDEHLDATHKGKLRKIIESINEPEVLIHGDIQPSNIRIGDAGVSFIDLETLSTGPAVVDLGALRRTLLFEVETSENDYNQFLDVPNEMCIEIWNDFIQEYFRTLPDIGEEEINKKLYIAEVICYILGTSKMIKNGASREMVDKAIGRLKELMDK